jgi:hypothetical protein
MAQLPPMIQLVLWTSVITLLPFLLGVLRGLIGSELTRSPSSNSPPRKIPSELEPSAVTPAPDRAGEWQDEHEVFDVGGRLIGHLRVRGNYRTCQLGRLQR